MDRQRSRNRTPESDSLFGAAAISAALHVAALVAALVVWPIFAPPVALPPDVLPVELISEETNIAEQEKADEPLPVPAELPMPPPPEPQPLNFPEPPPEPDELALEPDPTPPPPEAAKPQPPQPRYAMLPQPRAKPKPEKPKEEFDISKISQALDRAAKEPPPDQKAAKSAASAQRTTRAAGAQTGMSMSELDALKAQITEAMEKCWRIPDGAPDPASLTMRVKVFLNEDGTVASPPQLLDQGPLGDPYFRAAADSAMRAVHICAPYDLPPDKFAVWGELTIRFSPPGY